MYAYISDDFSVYNWTSIGINNQSLSVELNCTY